MSGVNKVIVIGNLGQNPEMRSTAGGSPVANLSLATSETWKDKQSGEKQERTEWHRIVLFNRLAEIAEQYLHKGSKVYIEGSLRTRKWKTEAGEDRYSTEIVCRDLQMLDGRQDRQEPSERLNTNGTEKSTTAPPESASFDDFEDDEIPF